MTSLVWPVLYQVNTGYWTLHGLCTTWWCLYLFRCPPKSAFFTYILYNLLVLQTCSVKFPFFVIFLSCMCHIYCMSARAGRQIPPLWLFWRFFHCFFPAARVISWGILFSPESRGLGMEDVIHCIDCTAHWSSVIFILGYINETDSTYLIRTVWVWLDHEFSNASSPPQSDLNAL